MNQGMDLSDMDGLLNDFDQLLKEIPDGRCRVHEKMAEIMKKIVDRNIDSSLSDSHGKIKGWQAAHIGSRGGYAAIRAEGGKSGADSPGAITNYLEGGHRVRENGKRYQVKNKKLYVDGRHFYKKSLAQLEAEAITVVEEWAEEVSERFGSE